MVSVGAITEAFSGGMSGFGNAMLNWLGIIIISTVILVGMWLIYIRLQYRISTEIFISRNLGDGQYNVGQIKNTKIRTIVYKGVRKWKIWMKKGTIPPLDDKYILPGNRVKLFKIGDNYIPANIKVGNPEMLIESIPMDMKLWQSLECAEIDKDYQDLKTRLMPVFIMLGTVLFCLIFAGVMIWLIVKTGKVQTETIINSWQAFDFQTAAEGFRP